jgi:hypothetical protein
VNKIFGADLDEETADKLIFFASIDEVKSLDHNSLGDVGGENILHVDILD